MLKYDDLPRLRELAEKADDAAETWWKANELDAMNEFYPCDIDFIAALNPATVIELLNMIERQQVQISRLTDGETE